MSVTVFVRSPDTFSERRFSPDLSIEQLKHKLEAITGIPSKCQRLLLFPDDEAAQALAKPLSIMDQDDTTLVQYNVQDWQCVKVENTDPHAHAGGEFTDVSQVEKFELTNEEYEKRPDTVLQDLKARSLGRFAPVAAPASSHQHRASPEQKVDARCIILSEGSDPDGSEKRGTIRFVGPTSFGDGQGDWVGIELDEPTGKNDGSVNDKRYFTCQPKRGVFVRPERVTVGDYPEVDEFADVMDSEEEL